MYFIILVAITFGISHTTPHSRIVNGTDAKLGEFPYIISLRLTTWHSCGGSILSADFVLTAAHCVFGYSPSSLTIQYGVVDISDDFTNSIQVKKIIVHEDYVPTTGFRHDIALLKLESSIPLSSTAQPIALPKQDQNFIGWSLGTLIGWGLPYTGGDVMERLQKVNIFIFPQEECSLAHGDKVDEINHVCAGVPEGGKGQCNGDSGGPLTYKDVLVGIVSWSVKPCTVAGYPGVFTRVAHHIDWIKEKMKII